MDQVMKAIEDLQNKVDLLEARAAIRDLVTDYCVGFDNSDWEKFISIWHEDAVWNIGAPFGSFSGHSGIKEAVYDVLYPVWRETHHLTSNLKIEFHSKDSASASCDTDCMGATKDGVVQMINATYHDEFERRDGVWKIARRNVTMHYFNAMPGIEMSAP